MTETEANESIKRLRELFEKEPLIDWNNTDQLANDIWLFLTDESMPDKKTIKKEAFLHEVGSMMRGAIDLCCQKQSVEYLNWVLNRMMLPSWKNNPPEPTAYELYRLFYESESCPIKEK